MRQERLVHDWVIPWKYFIICTQPAASSNNKIFSDNSSPCTNTDISQWSGEAFFLKKMHKTWDLVEFVGGIPLIKKKFSLRNSNEGFLWYLILKSPKSKIWDVFQKDVSHSFDITHRYRVTNFFFFWKLKLI